MSDLDSGFNTQAGINAVDVAEVTRDEFLRMIGKESDDNAGALERWLDGVEYLIKICAEREEAKWSTLSDRFAGIVCPNVDWDSKSELLKTIWQAATRHAVNCITAESRAEFDTAREHDWRQWVITRTEKGEKDG